jgi:D-xylose transport system permease protein
LYASRLGSISVGYDGSTYVLYAVAAVAAVVNGLALIGVSTAGEEIATALVLLAAVTVDSIVRRRGSTSK